MYPSKRSIYEFISRTDGYFQIPDFQRPYTWDARQIQTFWDDLKKVAERNNTHYFGTIVLIREDGHSVIIDGQQRLTTSLLLINAAYHILKKTPAKSLDNIYTDKFLKDTFLVNTRSSDIRNREKITLRTVTTDNNVLEKIFIGKELDSNEQANKLYKAYMLFKKFLDAQDNINNYIEALHKFEIVEITLDDKDDNPQSIFESINSLGEPLSPGDKIRNWALMLKNKEARRIVYGDYWKNIENNLTRVEKDQQVDYISDFFRTYLMCKNNKFISEEATHPEFKKLLKDIDDNNIESIKEFYNDVQKYLLAYLSIKFMKINPQLEMFREQIFSLKFLKAEIINTAIINIFVDFIDNKLTTEEVTNSLYLVETFLARRLIGGFKAEGLNTRFPELHKAIRAKQEKYSDKTYDDCLSAWMLETRGRTSSLPTDADITISIKTLNFYGNKTYQQQYVLAKICDHLSKESTLLHSIYDKQIRLSVEHIMPRKIGPKWRSDLGSDWENVHDKWLHTLANLTLTAYNQTYSNHSFAQKKTMEHGFAKSPLPLNKYIAEFDLWNEESLKDRARWLSRQIAKIWKYPKTTFPSSNNDGDCEYYSPYNWEIKSGEKPATVSIDSDEFEVNSWVDLYTKVLSFIQENFYDKFVDLIDNKDLFGIKDKPLITMNKDILSTVGELGHETFIERNIGVHQIMRNIIKICEYVEYDEDNCPVSFTLA